MAETQTFERKHFFIDRKFQGRYMVSFLVPMLLLLLFMLFTLYLAAQNVVGTTTGLVKKDIQDKISFQFQDEEARSVEAYEALMRDITSYLRHFSSNQEYRQVLLRSLLWVFGIGILLVIVQMALMTVFFSHKVAGPVYRLEMVCHNLIGGDYTDKIILRKGDEMQNLAQLMNEVVDRSRKRLDKLGKASSEQERAEVLNSLRL